MISGEFRGSEFSSASSLLENILEKYKTEDELAHF